MNSNKFKIFLMSLIIFFKISNLFSKEIKILAQVNNEIITNQDLKKEKIILNYLYNFNNNNISLDKIALDNLIELNIKKIELKKNNITITDLESKRFLNIVLKNHNKSLVDFEKDLVNKAFKNHLLEKIQIEVSWDKLIMQKFSHLIDINMDEFLSKNLKQSEDVKNLDNKIIIEKNKKLQSISEAYFNEVKNKLFIKY